MYRGLATRHLTGTPGTPHMLYDKLEGRVGRSEETGVVLVVDGKAISTENLATILGTHEGWGFKLTIVDALE